MRFSYNWIKTFFDTEILSPEDIQDLLTMHAFEVESLERHGDDAILDIKVLPDRAHDTLSHWGMAKEISALSGIPLKQDLFHVVDLQFTDKLFTEIESDRDAMRFLGAHIRNVEVKESPEWLKRALQSVGQKPINNIVDVTNYVMLAYGQPMHAYDTAKLTRDGDGHYVLIAERAGKEEEFKALDGKTYTIAPDMLVIRDASAKRTLGIAGIKGGEASKIDTETKDVILEAANFNPSLIRRTSQRLHLRTDASERFEKEIIPELALRAMKEAIHLILELAGNEVKVDGISDAYPRRRSPYRIGLGLRDVEKKLGVRISEEELTSILERLGASVRRVETKDILKLAESVLNAPYKLGASISFDAPYAFDCSSLTAYLFSQVGYAIPRISVDQYLYARAIDEGDLVAGDLIFLNRQTDRINHAKSIEFMPGAAVPQGVDHVCLYVGQGEVIHASPRKGQVVREKIAENENIREKIAGFGRIIFDEVRYVVTVPLERLDLMSKRAFLVSGNKEDLIEEIGRVYGYENIPSVELPETAFEPKVNKELYYTDKLRQELAAEGYSEVMTYAFVQKGEVELENPLASDKKFLRASLLPGLEKAYKENLLNKDLLGQKEIKIFEIGKVFKKDGEVLMLGKYPDKTEENLDEYLAQQPEPEEYDFEEPEPIRQYEPISPYPFIVRDLSLWVPEDTKPGKVEEIIRPFASDLCARLSLVDSFTKVDPHDQSVRQSYTWRFVFQSHERTLTDADANAIMDTIHGAVRAKGYEVR